jgi:hypothetical protein
MTRKLWAWGRVMGLRRSRLRCRARRHDFGCMVMVIVASLPGAAVLLVAWFRYTWLLARKRSPLGEGAAHA